MHGKGAPTLLVASTNPGKIREYAELLLGLPGQILFPRDLGLSLRVEEDGATYRANAERKARAYARVSGLLTLGDDSGLEVDALGGEPGIRSSRYAGEGADDEARRAFLLKRLQEVPEPRLARFRCVVALAWPSGALAFAEGVCQGEVITQPRGKGGFGYDPLFLVQGGGHTMAELTAAEKNRLSHRARAVQAIWPRLAEALAG